LSEKELRKASLFSVLLPAEVREHAHRGEKDGCISYWLQPKEYDEEAFKGAWQRIGQG